jgi:hypothetical protein
MGRPTHKAEFAEGPQAAVNFNTALRTILKVSPEEIKRRIEAATAAKKASSRIRAGKG